MKVIGSAKQQNNTLRNLPETVLVVLAEEDRVKHSVEHTLRRGVWLKRCPLLMSTQSTMSPGISANFSRRAHRDGWQGWWRFSLWKALKHSADLSLFVERVGEARVESENQTTVDQER